jgi:tRNA modification GTPase
VRGRFTSASAKPLPDIPAQHRVYFGSFGDGSHADEVVVAVKQLEPEEVVEVDCHGGRRVVAWVAELLGEFDRRKPARRDGWTILPYALTLRTASILLDQCHGAFDRVVDDILLSPESAGDKLAALARYAGVGRHLTEPWRVVIAGEPNVGKSSLVNAVAGFQRSVVSATPGTTRDVVSTVTAIDGWPVELLDTAGLRVAADELEAEGVTRATAVQADADLVVWVLDGSRPLIRPPEADFVVVNKTDMPPAWDWSLVPTAVRVSATTGEGISNLLTRIAARLVPESPPAGAAVPFSPALADRIVAARSAFLSGNFAETRRLLSACRADNS